MVLVVGGDVFMSSRRCRVWTSAGMRIESGVPGGDRGQ